MEVQTRMSSTTATVGSAVVLDGDALEAYRSRPRQLARWLLESRDTLREKYRELKVESKLTNGAPKKTVPFQAVR